MDSLEVHEYEPPARWRYEVARCRGCRARIVFLSRPSGRVPLDVSTLRSLDDGREGMKSHFLFCPRAASFGKKKPVAPSRAAGQGSLF